MKTRKPKILMVYSNMGEGGTQRQRSILSGELCKKYDFTMALFQNIQLFKFYGEIIDIKAPTSENPLISIKNLIKRILSIRKIVHDNQIDVILSSSVIANMVCLLTKKLFRIDTPLVITFNNSLKEKADDMGIKGTVSLFANRHLANYADKIVSVSKVLSEEISRMGFPREKAITIYNGLAINEMLEKTKEPIEEEYKRFFKKAVPVIISVGRLTRQKNYSSLIEAFSMLRQRHNARLVLVGSGDEIDILKNQCRTLGISDDVLFTGWHKNPYKFLNRSNVFVLSSLWEGFPNVLIEAMALGLPVISTNCPTGPDEIITNDNNGILIPINDNVALYEALKRIISNRKLAHDISVNGKKRANDFSIQSIAKEWDRLFHELINKRSNS